MLIFNVNQAIHINSMESNLLCVMQLRTNDVKVFDCPKFLTDSPNHLTHSILLPSRNGDDEVAVTLSLNGVTSYFHTRKPTIQEYESAENNGRSYDLTYDSPEWIPHSSSYNDQEIVAEERLDADVRGLMSMTASDILGNFNDRGHSALTSQNASMYEAAHTVYERHSQCASILSEISPSLCDDSFLSMLKSNVQVAFSSTKNNSQSTVNTLARNWGIGIEAAKRTVDATTQRIVRTVAHPSLSRRFRTNDRQLRYNRISAEMFTDTAQANITSKRGNRYSQLFSLPFGWVRAFGIPKKSDAHDALSLLFKREGVPTTMVMDVSKEQT